MLKLLLCTVLLLNAAVSHGAVFAPTKDRTVELSGLITETSAPAVNKILDLADRTKLPIDIVINSPGGMVRVADLIIRAMNVAISRGHVVRCAVTDVAASAMFLVLAHCSERYALESSEFMYHAPFFIVPSRTFNYVTARGMYEELRDAHLRMSSRILSKYPISRQEFMRNYLSGASLSLRAINEAMPKGKVWIRVVDDVVGYVRPPEPPLPPMPPAPDTP